MEARHVLVGESRISRVSAECCVNPWSAREVDRAGFELRSIFTICQRNNRKNPTPRQQNRKNTEVIECSFPDVKLSRSNYIRLPGP